MDKEFWLRLLGLTGSPNLPAIKQAWRKRASETHPDRGGKAEDFVEVTHAYKMLTDDSYRRHQKDKTRERDIQDLTVNMKVHIPWDDAFFGRETLISWNRVDVDENHQVIKTSGHVDVYTITLKIQEGTSGGTHQFPGKGLKKGAITGDCVIHILVMPDSRYTQISDIDIACTEHVPLDLLLKGGHMEVSTPWGLRKMTVKPGTMPGSKISIKKAGVKKRGSLVVTVVPKFPGEEELRSKAYEGMKIEWEIVDQGEQDTMTDEEAEILENFVKFQRDNKP
jgi:DnaJ-class molecular chaperone